MRKACKQTEKQRNKQKQHSLCLSHEIVLVSAVFYDTVNVVNNHVALQDRSIIIMVIIVHHHLTRQRTCARSIDSCDADKM
jgi:hypothetical protein